MLADGTAFDLLPDVLEHQTFARWRIGVGMPKLASVACCNGGHSNPRQKLASELQSKHPFILVGRVTNACTPSLEIPTYQILHATFAVDTLIHRYD